MRTWQQETPASRGEKRPLGLPSLILFAPKRGRLHVDSTTSYAQWSASRLGQAATPSERYPPSSSSRILSRAELDTPSRPRNQLLEEQVEIERRLEESRQRARERQSQLDQAKSASISAVRFTTPVHTAVRCCMGHIVQQHNNNSPADRTTSQIPYSS